MRGFLDRLGEAGTALDKQLLEYYYQPTSPKRKRAMRLLWKSKRHLWLAQMLAFDAAAGPEPPDPA